MSDLIHAIRDASARREAVRQYALAFDAWAEREQVYALGGSEIESAGAHEFALWVLRAYKAEMEDPQPPRWHHTSIPKFPEGLNE